MNNFSPHLQQVLAIARNVALKENHNYVGTEHLLIALLKWSESTALAILKRNNIDPEAVEASVRKHVGPGQDSKMIGNPAYTPRVKKTLAHALKEARKLNDTIVATEHLLLGMLFEGEGIAAHVLKGEYGLEYETARSTLLDIRAGKPAARKKEKTKKELATELEQLKGQLRTAESKEWTLKQKIEQLQASLDTVQKQFAAIAEIMKKD